MNPEIVYEVKFQPWDRSWCLSGPVGAHGRLRFRSARDAASHARWDAKAKGGTIRVHDAEGNLFKTIEIDPDADENEAYVLPSV